MQILVLSSGLLRRSVKTALRWRTLIDRQSRVFKWLTCTRPLAFTCALCYAVLVGSVAAQQNAEQTAAPKALDTARQDAVAHPQDADAQYRLAYLLLAAKQPRESLAAYTAAARLRVPTADDLVHVGSDYVLLSAWSDAARWFTAATRMDARNLQAWYYLGRADVQLNRFTEARAAFRRTLELDPVHARAMSNLAIVSDALNDHGEAVRFFERAVELARQETPPDAQPLIDFATSLVDSNDAARARMLLLEAHLWAPDDLRLHKQLARAQTRLGELTAARSELEWILARDPAYAAEHFQLGRIYKQLGNDQQAAAEFRESERLLKTSSSPVP